MTPELRELYQEVILDHGKKPRNFPELGKLTVFSGVCEFPMRVKCALLPWHTLKAALRGGGAAGFHGVDL